MIYTNDQFKGHYPTGTAAVVRANSPQEAADMLNVVLREQHNLSGDAKPEDMIEFTDNTIVRILNDGDY